MIPAADFIYGALMVEDMRTKRYGLIYIARVIIYAAHKPDIESLRELLFIRIFSFKIEKMVVLGCV